MKQHEKHGPCNTCDKCNEGRCGETNAIVHPLGGVHCSWYKKGES